MTILNWISSHIPPWVWILLVAHFAILGTVAYLILLERKVASWVQDRIGPNRVGLGFGIIPGLKDKKMGGLGQPLADGLKFIVKEDYRPAGVDRILFTVAPGVMILVIIISIAVLPWGGIKRSTRVVNFAPGTNLSQAQSAVDASILNGVTLVGQPTYTFQADDFTHPTGAIVTYDYPFQIARLNIGVLYILAALSLAVYGVVIGGWASNNKYSFLGGLRATVNMISYEIPLGLAVLCVVVMYGTLDLTEIVDRQAHYWGGIVPAWNVFTQPLAFVMFLICIHAEANRAPFDLAEAEQELVGGYHTEYSAMRFALFFLAEYAGMITTSAVCVALFFGGWHLPWIEWAWPALRGNVDAQHPEITTSLVACIVRAIVFFAKTLFFIFVFMWVRWSLPRFRFDQVMMLAWRGLIPISLALLMMTSIVVFIFHGGAIGGSMALTLLIANIFVTVLIMLISRVIPPAPLTNRRLKVIGSRFSKTPLPAG
jgi:NADH-quinone oxidoreductase subunit H